MVSPVEHVILWRQRDGVREVLDRLLVLPRGEGGIALRFGLVSHPPHWQGLIKWAGAARVGERRRIQYGFCRVPCFFRGPASFSRPQVQSTETLLNQPRKFDAALSYTSNVEGS